MADRTDKNHRNKAGNYYNDLSCIDCGLCCEVAPQIFARDDDEGFAYVKRQPASPAEISAAEEARLSCPTESIGNDG